MGVVSCTAEYLKRDRMNVLAVIPARAGSKRIPNKNLRLIGEKPLVAYAIEHAQNALHVTDIVVTTDSPEIAIVAEQMGVMYRRRPYDLARDETTLDPVVWDAWKMMGRDYDFVITLQPTAPVLKPETIDNALEYAFKEGIDTLVSVYSQPGLAWKKDADGTCTPLYGSKEDRRNSQYLPPYYCETGAFLISNPIVMAENSRIGGVVDIFEISADESLNIRTFEDLLLARQIIADPAVAFFVNGNNAIGLGHVYRVLELVDEFYAKPVIYFDRNVTTEDVFQDTQYELVGVDGSEGLLRSVHDKDYDIFINDILSTSETYMLKLRTALPNSHIVNFEDEGAGTLHADLIFNALLGEGDNKRVKAGPDYYIAPKQLLLYRPIAIREYVSEVLITFGGADPQNYTDEVLRIIADNAAEYTALHFTVVLGPAKEEISKIDDYVSMANVTILRNVTNMPELMAKSDIAIASRGRTCYELAVLGIPTISLAENDREETHVFVSHENGFHYLGRNPSEKMIKSSLDLYISLSREERQEIQKRLLKTDLRNGRKRVMGLMQSLS